MLIVTIKDSNAGIYQPPFFQPTMQSAVRLFRMEVNRASDQNMIYLYPEEFDLVQLGEFDERTGEIKYAQQHVINGAKLKNEVKK